MNRMFTYMSLCICALLLLSCHGSVEDPYAVPEGVLRIFPDKTQIIADGNDKVTFKAMFGTRDVSGEKTFRLMRTYGDSGDEKLMAYGADSYSTATPGTYTFRAEYYYGGRYISDNSVVITATEYYTGEEQDFEGRLLCMCFTSTTCTSCPSAARNISELQEKYPDAFSVVSVHRYLASPDPMETEHTEELISVLGGFAGLPAIFWNMDRDSRVLNGAVETSYDSYMESYEPFCGVSIETQYVESTRELCIDLGVTSNLPADYLYYVFLVEDGIDEYEQCGDYYVHQNVLRDLLTAARGDKLNSGLPLSIGVESKARKTTVLDPQWKVENMRVIVAAATSMDNGKTYVVNNVNECKIL